MQELESRLTSGSSMAVLVRDSNTVEVTKMSSAVSTDGEDVMFITRADTR